MDVLDDISSEAEEISIVSITDIELEVSKIAKIEWVNFYTRQIRIITMK